MGRPHGYKNEQSETSAYSRRSRSVTFGKSKLNKLQFQKMDLPRGEYEFGGNDEFDTTSRFKRRIRCGVQHGRTPGDLWRRHGLCPMAHLARRGACRTLVRMEFIERSHYQHPSCRCELGWTHRGLCSWLRRRALAHLANGATRRALFRMVLTGRIHNQRSDGRSQLGWQA